MMREERIGKNGFWGFCERGFKVGSGKNIFQDIFHFNEILHALL